MTTSLNFFHLICKTDCGLTDLLSTDVRCAACELRCLTFCLLQVQRYLLNRFALYRVPDLRLQEQSKAIMSRSLIRYYRVRTVHLCCTLAYPGLEGAVFGVQCLASFKGRLCTLILLKVEQGHPAESARLAYGLRHTRLCNSNAEAAIASLGRPSLGRSCKLTLFGGGVVLS